MEYEEYGEVINSPKTYKGIAEELHKNSVLIGWTDLLGTHYDILFTLTALQYGTNIQGGIRPRTDLFVSIMRKGAFAFDISNDTHPGYYGEKLHTGGGESGEKLAELINGVKVELRNE